MSDTDFDRVNRVTTLARAAQRMAQTKRPGDPNADRDARVYATDILDILGAKPRLSESEWQQLGDLQQDSGELEDMVPITPWTSEMETK